MQLIQITPPAIEPISLADAKKHLRIDQSDYDGEIPAYITAATNYTETYTRRALLLQTWRMTLSAFPSGQIRLPKGKTYAITALAYVDADGAAQTLVGPEASPVGTDYQWNLDDVSGGVLMPPVDGSWPDTQADNLNAVQITFQCGYASRADVPGQLLAGLRFKLADLYDLRSDVDLATTKSFGHGPKADLAEALLTPWRLAWF